MQNNVPSSAFLIILALLLNPIEAAAQIYKITHPDGSVSFSDQSTPHSEEVFIEQPIPQSTPVPSNHRTKTVPNTKQDKSSSNKSAPTVYTSFSISNPKDGEAVRANTGTVNVSITLTPALDVVQGDSITLFLDGKFVADHPGDSTSFTLTNLDRGSHTLTAKLKNAAGLIIHTTPSIVFNVLKTHINN